MQSIVDGFKGQVDFRQRGFSTGKRWEKQERWKTTMKIILQK